MSELLCSLPTWLSGGHDRDVVVASRVRLARNLADSLFPWRASLSESTEVRSRLLSAIECLVPNRTEFHFESLESSESLALIERGWANPSFDPDPSRAISVVENGLTLFSTNDTDHLRIECWVPGADFEEAYARACKYDEFLDGEVGWAATLQQGYLTSRIDDVGSALRVSTLVFIPGILASGVFDRVSRGLLASGIEPRLRCNEGGDADLHEGGESSFDGDGGSDIGSSSSPFVELSARVPFGVREEEFFGTFHTALEGLIDGERRTRERLLGPRRAVLEDSAYRADALLNAARLLGEKECFSLLTDLRGGIAYGVAPSKIASKDDPYSAVDALRFVVGPGCLRVLARSLNLSEEGASLDELRAKLVRDALSR